MPVTSCDLVAAIGDVVSHRLTSEIFQSPEPPSVFVDPAIETVDEQSPFAAEVILIGAAAAVGKTTVARHVASAAGIPLLDLAQVPVAAGSLRGLVGGYIESDPESVEALLRGDLALVIDALDEGRVRSGEDGFLQFLFTMWELLDSAARSSSPIAILFGRPTTIGDVEATLELHNEGKPDDKQIRYRRAELAFFDEEGAVELVRKYAESMDDEPSRIDRQWGAISVTVRTYFRSIAEALGLDASEDLWSDDLGRAFAGYAPVLAALGSLISETSDFQSLTARLDRNYTDAWAPIEEVIRLILEREIDKLQQAVAPLLSDGVEIPSDAYSPQEQLGYLIDHVHGERTLQGTIPEGLRGRDADAYVTAVNQLIPEHPFVRDRQFANPVFAGFALAAGMGSNQLQRPTSHELLGQAARSPFLWRSFRHGAGSGLDVLDGVYLGYLLTSRWNDPGEVAGQVTIRWEDHRARVRIADLDWEIVVAPPIRFFEKVEDLVAMLEGSSDVTLELAGEAMTVSGPVVLVAPSLRVTTNKILLEGSVWLEAEAFESTTSLSLNVAPDAEVGWNETVSEHYPWSRAETKRQINPLIEPQPANKLEAFIAATAQRPPSQSVVVHVHDLSVAPDEPRWSWTRREYSEIYRRFLRLLIDEGLAGLRQLATSGHRAKGRVSFFFRWGDLAAVARGGLEDRDLKRALDRAYDEFPQRLLYP